MTGIVSIDGRVTVVDTEHFTVERYATRAEWLAARPSGIGGSDAPALWGLGFKRPFALWCEKRGLVADDVEDSDYLRIGARMEPIIADEHAYATGRSIIDPGRTTILRSREWPWMFVSLDRALLASVALEPALARLGPGVLECKNRNAGAWAEWTNGAPEEVQAQIQHAFAVTRWRWGSAAAIIGGNRPRHVDVEPIPSFVGEHVETCRAFWQMVQLGAEPAATGHDSDERALKALYPGESGETIDLDDEAVKQAALLVAAKRDAKLAELRATEAEQWFRQRLGAATFGRLPGGGRVQLRVEARRAEVCGCGAEVRRATAPRVLRFKKL